MVRARDKHRLNAGKTDECMGTKLASQAGRDTHRVSATQRSLATKNGNLLTFASLQIRNLTFLDGVRGLTLENCVIAAAPSRQPLLP